MPLKLSLRILTTSIVEWPSPPEYSYVSHVPPAKPGGFLIVLRECFLGVLGRFHPLMADHPKALLAILHLVGHGDGRQIAQVGKAPDDAEDAQHAFRKHPSNSMYWRPRDMSVRLHRAGAEDHSFDFSFSYFFIFFRDVL